MVTQIPRVRDMVVMGYTGDTWQEIQLGSNTRLVVMHANIMCAWGMVVCGELLPMCVV